MLRDNAFAVFYRGTDDPEPSSRFAAKVADIPPQWYGCRTVGAQRYYNAKSVGDQISAIIELDFLPEVTPDMWVVLSDGKRYDILQLQHTTDSDNLPCTVLTLQDAKDVMPYDP